MISGASESAIPAISVPYESSFARLVSVFDALSSSGILSEVSS